MPSIDNSAEVAKICGSIRVSLRCKIDCLLTVFDCLREILLLPFFFISFVEIVAEVSEECGSIRVVSRYQVDSLVRVVSRYQVDSLLIVFNPAF